MHHRVTTYLTFKDRAEEAVRFYVSIFKNSEIVSIARYEEDGGPMPKGALLNATFRLDGQEFMAMDGGPYFTFGEGTSLLVDCETQEEIDHYWEKLAESGEKQQCGWLKDKYGLSWQIVPSAILGKMMTDKDRDRSRKVMEALLKMQKIEISKLTQAYEQAGKATATK